jgi:toxin FitB
VNLVDPSGWLEYFANGPNAQRFLPALKDVESLVVPVVSIYEVFKVVLRERGKMPPYRLPWPCKKPPSWR